MKSRAQLFKLSKPSFAPRFIFMLLFLLFAQMLFAEGDFATVDELASRLTDKNTMIIDTRSAKDYKKDHILNSVNVPVTKLSSAKPVKWMLKNRYEIAHIFAAKGISPQSDIYLYCTKGGRAGRMYWILKMMGAKNVKVYDGSYNEWVVK